MFISKGIFYDGHSSAAHEATVYWDKTTGEITVQGDTFESVTGSLRNAQTENEYDNLRIRFGALSTEILKISDPQVISEIKVFQKENGLESWYWKLVNSGLTTHLLISCGILGLLVAAYLLILPWIAEKAVALLPESYDNQMGDTFYNEFSEFNDVDSAKTKALNAFAAKLSLQNKKKLSFSVVESSTVNAFALPNGKIVVYTGILQKMNNYQELVALLGHEATHVNNRHSMKMLCRNVSGYLFVSLLLSDINGIMAVVGDNVRSLQSLSFSRKFEEEADNGGLDIMMKNKVNPKGMADLFSKLNEKSNLSLPAFLSSHPMTEERIKNVNTFRAKNRSSFDNKKELSALFATMKK